MSDQRITFSYREEDPRLTPQESPLARRLDDGTYELREHLHLCPLAPLDIVRVDGDPLLATAVEKLEPLYTYEVQFHLPADAESGKFLPADHRALIALDELETQWRRDAWITRTTNFSMFISAHDRDWLISMVLSHRYVELYDQVRDPSFQLDWDVARLNPGMGPKGEGVWL